MRSCFFYPVAIVVCAVLFLAASGASAVDIDWVNVGGQGNSCDVQAQGCFGGVSDAYRIGKYEVTNDQYTEFLNAVADADPNSLYDTNMGTGSGGIARTGASGNFSYSAAAGRENRAVNFISFYDALRFANWLHNGQPVGAQGNTTTEDGAYTITALGLTLNSISRNPGANVFLTSEDEWYKAAYYDQDSASFYDYANHDGTQMVCGLPGPGPSKANCGNVVGDVTAVGAYMEAMSPNGTFDQGGNLLEWNESQSGSSKRVLRSGSFTAGSSVTLSAASRIAGNPGFPGQEFVGFRVATVIPEPSTGLLVGGGLLGLAGQRRHSARKKTRKIRA